MYRIQPIVARINLLRITGELLFTALSLKAKFHAECGSNLETRHEMCNKVLSAPYNLNGGLHLKSFNKIAYQVTYQDPGIFIFSSII